MTAYEAMEDDAAPGEWIVLDVSDEVPTALTVARFYGHGAEPMARRFARDLESELLDPFADRTGRHNPYAGCGLVAMIFSLSVGLILLLFKVGPR